MRKIILFIFLCLTLSLSALLPSHAVERTLVLQQGTEGYEGVKDTWISTNDWESPPLDTRNYGQNNILLLERNGRNNPLLRFDLSSIPANSKVVSVVLSLYNLTHSGSSGQDYARRVRLYGVLVDWDEGNLVDSPINVAIGAHGATGYNAFEYYSGEGTHVPWGERGYGCGARITLKILRAMRTW